MNDDLIVQVVEKNISYLSIFLITCRSLFNHLQHKQSELFMQNSAMARLQFLSLVQRSAYSLSPPYKLDHKDNVVPSMSLVQKWSLAISSSKICCPFSVKYFPRNIKSIVEPSLFDANRPTSFPNVHQFAISPFPLLRSAYLVMNCSCLVQSRPRLISLRSHRGDNCVTCLGRHVMSIEQSSNTSPLRRENTCNIK